MAAKTLIAVLAILAIIISSLSTYIIIEKADNAPAAYSDNNQGLVGVNVVSPSNGQIGVDVVNPEEAGEQSI